MLRSFGSGPVLVLVNVVVICDPSFFGGPITQ
jgi:hypothetical protein